VLKACSNINNQRDFGDKLQYLEQAFNTLKDESKILSENEYKALAKFTDIFTTCSLDPEEIKGKLYRLTDTDKDGHEVEKLVKLVESSAKKFAKTVCECNRHHHTKSCKKYDTTCRYNIPHFPSKETLIAVPVIKLTEYAKTDEDFLEFKDLDKDKIENKIGLLQANID
jgi:hypothetical protein